MERLKLLPGHRKRFDDFLSELRIRFLPVRGRSHKAIKALSPLVLSPRKPVRALSIEAKPTMIAAKHSPNQALIDQLSAAKSTIKDLETRISAQTTVPEKSQTPLQVSRKPPLFEQKRSARGKEVGVSYDSSKMRATLANLDLEEMCRCVEGAVRAGMDAGGRYQDGDVGGELRERFDEVFAGEGRRSSVDQGEIYNFTKNALLRSKAEKEVVVVLLVYLQRLHAKTGLSVSPNNWKRLIFTALILASKIWDDESFETRNFAEAFTLYPPQELKTMENTFLDLIGYQLSVKSSEYAQAYFQLRTFSTSIHRNFPLKSLDADTVQRLQHNSHRAEASFHPSPFPVTGPSASNI